MKKLFKIFGYALIILAVLIGAMLIYVKTSLPDVGSAEELTVDATPERIERGRYLAHSVTVCMDCHSSRDWSKFSGPITEGTLGMGGEVFDRSVGLPGVYYAKNITPTGIARYTDGELFRVITTGVSKEGKAMFPIMPYPYYGKMDREDIYSIIAYVRSLAPIINEVPAAESDFPMNFIINTIPVKSALAQRPDPSDELAYGGYLVNAAGCIECHTQVDKGQIIQSVAFSGGREFKYPDGSVVRSSNITQDPATGIGQWTAEQFVARFQMYADSAYSTPVVGAGEFNTVMPWTLYGRMNHQDLASIFTYLKTIGPISNNVSKYSSSQEHPH